LQLYNRSEVPETCHFVTLSIKENNPIEIEAKWQKYWADNKTFAAHTRKPKHYVLTCFLIHLELVYVGHPLGYIASDVYSI
jgi:leucyl-tRNA synthetase